MTLEDDPKQSPFFVMCPGCGQFGAHVLLYPMRLVGREGEFELDVLIGCKHCAKTFDIKKSVQSLINKALEK